MDMNNVTVEYISSTHYAFDRSSSCRDIAWKLMQNTQNCFSRKR